LVLTAGAAERGVELRGATPADQLAHLRSLPWARTREEEQFLLVAGVSSVQELSRVLYLAPLLADQRPDEEDRDLVARASSAVLEWPSQDDGAALVRMLVPTTAGDRSSKS
jgi:hypothetical protein